MRSISAKSCSGRGDETFFRRLSRSGLVTSTATRFRAIATSFACFAACSSIFAAVPGKHGPAFDGCPLCTAGKIGADGTPLDPITGVPDFSNAGLTKPDGLASRPARPSASGQSAPAPLPAKNEPPQKVKQRADGFWDVSFANLASFAFETPTAEKLPALAATQTIPEDVRSLDGKRVRIAGFMLPTKLEAGLVKEFLLIRNSLMCCFGIVPAANEWVVVIMKGKGVVPAMDVPLHFYGTLRVGEMYNDKTFVALYAMDGEKVSVE
jgi:hypothetical protein